MPALTSSTSWSRGVFVLVVFALAGFMIAAGGLGLAPLAALGGIGGLVFAAAGRAPRRVSLSLIAALLFLLWAALSYLWSPFSNPEYLLRLLAGAPLYIAFFLLCKDLDGRARRLAQGGVILCVISAAVFLTGEAVFQGAVTASHRDVVIPEQVWRNLGHGLSAWVVIAPACAVMLVVARGAPHAATALGILGAGILGAVAFGLTSNLAGLVAALAAGGVALLGARTTVAALGVLAAFGVLAAPVIGLSVDTVPPGLRALLPASWDLRLEAWQFASQLITEKPLTGWGFDASRMVSDEISHRGQTASVIPLHPHNLGLHAWLELGLVGASLLAGLLVLVSRAVAYAPGLTRRQGVSAAAAGGAYLAMAQVSYGMWQEWWIAALAFAASAAALAGPKTPHAAPA